MPPRPRPTAKATSGPGVPTSNSRSPNGHGKESKAEGLPSRQEAVKSVSASSEDGEGDDDEYDEDEDEDDEDEEEEEDGPDENEEKTGFDEKFLAQLMAMDPLFGGKASSQAGAHIVPDVQCQAVGFAAAATPTRVDAGLTQPPPQSTTSFPNMPAYASAASTPSNEFYDGAINFLTEVLGSSDSSLFQQSTAGGPSLPSEWSGEAVAAPSPAPTQAQFKNIQPLISNLIARLKGQPVDESSATQPQILEEDLVVLLQSLMAQRQAQVERKSAQAQTHQLPSGEVDEIGKKSSEVNEPNQARHMQATTTNVRSSTSKPHGISIVDFEFGEDDDDPDFDPGNVNLDFGNSAEFAQALANVTKDSQTISSQKTGAEQEANDKVWQDMFNNFGSGIGVPISPSKANDVRRTRSTSKNAEMQMLASPHDRERPQDASAVRATSAVSSNRYNEDQSLQADTDEGTSTRDTEEPGEGMAGKSRKRKLYTAEEALARRREANRDCARRQRARKKQETEQIRMELERIRNMQANGQAPPGEIIEATSSLVGQRKRGRPLGSRNRRTIEEMERYAAHVAEDSALSDLRADNRMLRSEMHRLQEENAQLRARVLRHEEVFEMLGKSDLIKRKPLHPPVIESEDEVEDDVDERHSYHLHRDDFSDHAQRNRRTKDPAAEFLAFNPFRRPFADSGGRARASQSTIRDRAPREERQATAPGRRKTRRARDGEDEEEEDEFSMDDERWERLAARFRRQRERQDVHSQQSYGGSAGSRRNPLGNEGATNVSSSGSLQDLLRIAANEMGGLGSG